MDPVRLGLQFRALRRRAGMTQEQLAARAGVSRSLISRIERGLIAGIAHRRMRHVATALGATLDYYLRFQGEALDRMLDEAHAEIVDATVALYREAGWEVAFEVSFAIDGERGSVDVLAWHRPTGAVAVNEIKSAVPDSRATVHVLDRKARLALRIARERGWVGTSVSRVLVVGEGRTSRRRVDRHAELFGAAFPIRGRDVSAWIRDPSGRPISGLLYLRPRTVRARTAHPEAADTESGARSPTPRSTHCLRATGVGRSSAIASAPSCVEFSPGARLSRDDSARHAGASIPERGRRR